MPRVEAYSEVPGRGPMEASFNPVVPICVLVYQSFTESTLILSLVTVLTVTVKSATAPVPSPAAATVTESLAEYPVPPWLIVTPVTLPPASITTSNPVSYTHLRAHET